MLQLVATHLGSLAHRRMSVSPGRVPTIPKEDARMFIAYRRMLSVHGEELYCSVLSREEICRTPRTCVQTTRRRDLAIWSSSECSDGMLDKCHLSSNLSSVASKAQALEFLYWLWMPLFMRLNE